MTQHTTIVSDGFVGHDPNGPDVQVHEEGDDVYVTFSHDYIKQMGWLPDDEVFFEVTPSGIQLTNINAEIRGTLRQKVEELLRAGPEL